MAMVPIRRRRTAARGLLLRKQKKHATIITGTFHNRTKNSMATIKEVRDYWQENPLLSFELKDLGSPAFFEELDRIKRRDIESFAFAYWAFDSFKNKKVLDVGCGPGWLTAAYAQNGACVYALDLTLRALELTQKHLRFRNTDAHLQQASAEELPFKDNTFDLVVASGVLHHTPDTLQAFRECLRVTKPGGRAKITLYRKGIFHTNETLFNFTRKAMQWLNVKHPGADMASTARNADDFIRQYDGVGNPIGIAKTNKEWKALLAQCGFTVLRLETHFFPARFLPFRRLPTTLHFFCDRLLGTMAYFDLQKPSA